LANSIQKKRPVSKSKLLVTELRPAAKEQKDIANLTDSAQKSKNPSRRKLPAKKTNLARKIKLKLPTKEKLKSDHNLGVNEDSFDLTDEVLKQKTFKGIDFELKKLFAY